MIAFASHNLAALLWYSVSRNERCCAEGSNFLVKWISRSRELFSFQNFLVLVASQLLHLSLLLVLKGVRKLSVKIQSKYINRWEYSVLVLLPGPCPRCLSSSVLLLIVQSLQSPQQWEGSYMSIPQLRTSQSIWLQRRKKAIMSMWFHRIIKSSLFPYVY